MTDAPTPQRARARQRGRARGRHQTRRCCGRSARPRDGAAKPGAGGGHEPRPKAGRPARRGGASDQFELCAPRTGAVRAPEWRAATEDGSRGLNLGARGRARQRVTNGAQVNITTNLSDAPPPGGKKPTATAARPATPPAPSACSTGPQASARCQSDSTGSGPMWIRARCAAHEGSHAHYFPSDGDDSLCSSSSSALRASRDTSLAGSDSSSRSLFRAF